jgi:hypothetical protein
MIAVNWGEKNNPGYLKSSNPKGIGKGTKHHKGGFISKELKQRRY